MKVSRYIFYVTIVVLARQVFLGVRQVAANPLNAKSKTTAVFSVHPNNHRAVGIHLALCITAAHARRKYSSYSQEPLLPVCRVTTRSRLGTKAMSWPPEPGL